MFSRGKNHGRFTHTASLIIALIHLFTFWRLTPSSKWITEILQNSMWYLSAVNFSDNNIFIFFLFFFSFQKCIERNNFRLVSWHYKQNLQDNHKLLVNDWRRRTSEPISEWTTFAGRCCRAAFVFVCTLSE